MSTTVWQGPDGRWRVIVGRKRSRRGTTILYRSKDFVHWVKSQHLLHSAENTGMWECTDFFLVSSVDKTNAKYVLKVSLNDTITKYDVYTVGQYYQEKDKYVPNTGSVEGDSGLRYDYGKYYASKSFFNSEKNQRILIGWVNESDTVENNADVEVSFELSMLKKAEVMDPSWVNPQLLCSQKGATVKGGVGPFGLLVLASKDLEEQTAVFFIVFRGNNRYVVLMCSDQSRSSLNHDPDKTTYGAFLDVDPLQENLSLQSLIDHSIVESFGVGRK
ncbi:hypothetical protein GIB67_033641 [Kingdonia uniflora]|uniref:Glycosyl hydrolase family 32 N-terminal domain-containing protein n=1 Tax=Kingdonia uniflora TaxID=39325 RepID=A0A7J7LAG2_9MAGN|nr:hypothetical protein GIB67_033641 [Kingdonia uniflora]